MKYRSVLFVPGHEENKIKKAYTLNADIVVLDLESSVPNSQKEQAKKIIKKCDVNKNQTYIRIFPKSFFSTVFIIHFWLELTIKEKANPVFSFSGSNL